MVVFYYWWISVYYYTGNWEDPSFLFSSIPHNLSGVYEVLVEWWANGFLTGPFFLVRPCLYFYPVKSFLMHPFMYTCSRKLGFCTQRHLFTEEGCSYLTFLETYCWRLVISLCKDTVILVVVMLWVCGAFCCLVGFEGSKLDVSL